jgi:hypothetical protein
MQLDSFDLLPETSEAERNRAKQEEQHSSRIIVTGGFTNIRTGFGFVVMSDPPDGWRSVLDATSAVTGLFGDISTPGFLRVLAFLAEKQHFSFAPSAIERTCALDEEQCMRVVDALARYGLEKKKVVSADCDQTTIYDFDAHRLPLLLVVLAYAREFIDERRSFYGYNWSRAGALY